MRPIAADGVAWSEVRTVYGIVEVLVKKCNISTFCQFDPLRTLENVFMLSAASFVC